MLTARRAIASSDTSAVNAAFTGAIGTLISPSPASTFPPDAVMRCHTRTGNISGTVFSSQGAVVGDGTVTLVELRRSVKTGADGTFRFDNIRPGHYHVSVESPREGSAANLNAFERRA